MISVVVRADHAVEALAATLAALVPAVAEGLVADAVVLSSGADEAVTFLSEAAGATLLVGPELSWTDGARAARREWILCLAAGDVPRDGWIGALGRFIAFTPADRGFGRMVRGNASLMQRWAGLVGARDVRSGDLVRRGVLLRGGPRGERPARIAAAVERDPAFGRRHGDGRRTARGP